MNPLLFTITQTGFLASENGVNYVMIWADNMLKVTGPETCYYLLETVRGLEQANCALTVFTVLIGN